LSSKSLLHLALALDGAGWHPAAWREPDARPGELFTGNHWLYQAQAAQAGRLDFVTIADSHRLQSTRPDGPDDRTDQVRGRLDAIMLAAWLAPRTRHLGIVPAAGTTVTEPFLLSTQIATLDVVSGGRAGWLAQVSRLPTDGGYVGPRDIPKGAAVWEEASEHIEVVRRLWESWEDGAEIRDAVTHRFLDRRRIGHIDFAGRYLSVKGPSITPRPPQGQPVVAVVADGKPATALAAGSADIVFATPTDEHQLETEPSRIDAELIAHDRERASVRIWADVVVFIDRDPSAASARKIRLDACDTRHDGADRLVFTGNAPQLAEQLVGWRELGYDGFRLWPGTVPHDLHAITRALVTELQVRCAFRRDYEPGTLRERLGFGAAASHTVPRADLSS
jgi:alkanesulfonate monooxygenase SsuD/methylene tetrahydromethanopterin reductase-like flavin-dependent oxidoreductase (luciferase family)